MKILIIKLSSIGDIIHAFPAIIDAKNNIPNLTIDWLVDQNFEAIPKLLNKNNNIIINQIIAISLRDLKKNKSFNNFKKFFINLLNLKAKKYDLIIDAQGLLKSAIIARFIKATKITGLNWQSCREPLASLFYNNKFNINKQLHAVVRIRKLFSLSLNYIINCDQNINFGLDKKYFDKLSELIINNYIVFLHGTTWETKEWPIEHWDKLSKLLATKNIKIIITFANNNLKEQKFAEQLLNKNNNIIILRNLDIEQICCMLAHAKAAVAVDTGFAHLAGALKVPVIGIYGATSIITSQIIGENCVNLQSKYHCSPCYSRLCLEYKNKKSLTKQPCLQLITPEMIFDKLF